MGEDGESVERRQQSNDELLPGAGFTDARLGGKPGRSRTAHVACKKEGCRAADHDGVRSRSRRTGRHRPMLSGGTVAGRLVRRTEIEIVCQNERLERLASLCAAKYAGHVRSNERFIARTRTAA